MTKTPYTISAIKTFRGTEGSGFNAKLLCNGKHVADVSDMADGGPLRIDWRDYAAPRVEGSFYSSYKNETMERMMTPDERNFEEWFLALPREVYFVAHDGSDHMKDSEAFLNGLVGEAETLKRVEATLKRDFKKGVVYIKDGAVYTTKPKNVAAIPSWIEQISAKGHIVLNNMDIKAALALAAPLMVQA